MHQKELRGFRIIKSSRRRNYSLKLFAQNGSRFYVMITRYFLRIPFQHKIYEFSDQRQAEFCYDKVSSI